MAFNDWRAIVDAKVRDSAGKLGQTERDAAIVEAVKRYSRHRPLEKIHELVGDGVLVTHALPVAYEEGFSSIRSIEYPVGRQDPEYLDEADYGLYRDPATSTLKLRFFSLVLGNAVKAYVAYTVRHQVTEG